MRRTMRIFCIQCNREVEARFTHGGEIYPHRPDLRSLPFWKCDGCGNFVGCHHRSSDWSKPLGSIPTEAVRKMRRRIHAVLDPLWRERKIPRRKIYGKLSASLGYEYHTAGVNSLEVGETVLQIIEELSKG